jgi:hypothetical protein
MTSQKSWQQAVSDVVWHSLVARTESRYGDLSFKQYSNGEGPGPQRDRFYKAWTSSVEEMHYRLRSARTRKLFSAAFTQMICAIPQGALKTHFDEVSSLLLSDTRWEDLRDILMLSLSARSYIPKPHKEDN